MDDHKIEAEIQAKGLTAPRVKPEDITANIASEWYFTASDGVLGSRPGIEGSRLHADTMGGSLHLLTFCVLVLRNGFTVTGESACASPENFDAEMGRNIARDNAFNKVWPLMGYALKERLANTPPVDNDHVAAGGEQFSAEVVAANKVPEPWPPAKDPRFARVTNKELNVLFDSLRPFGGAATREIQVAGQSVPVTRDQIETELEARGEPPIPF